MSGLPNPISELSPPVSADHRLSIGLFTRKTRAVWVVVALLTIAPELIPIAPMPFAPFCLYYLLKVICFLALGFLAPLAFQSLNGIRLGLALSFTSAFLIETLQGLLHNGHVFHWYELAGKLALILLGFALSLGCRYERKIVLGPIVYPLTQPSHQD